MTRTLILVLCSLSLCGILHAESSEVEADTVNLINALREEHGLLQLHIDPLLTVVAREYAERCVQRGVLSHQDERGQGVLYRIRQTGDTAVRAGEVLGKGPDAELIVTGWKSSRDHNQVLLDPVWTHTGAGAVPVPQGYLIVTIFKTRVFDTVKTEFLNNGIVLSLYSFYSLADVPFLYHLGREYKPIEVSAENQNFQFFIPGNRLMYYILFGIRNDGAAVYTDRIIVEKEY